MNLYNTRNRNVVLIFLHQKAIVLFRLHQWTFELVCLPQWGIVLVRLPSRTVRVELESAEIAHGNEIIRR